MPTEKITLAQLESFLFGMLFLNRLSDEFDRKGWQLRDGTHTHLKDQPDLVRELLEDKTSYGETFSATERPERFGCLEDEA